MSNYLRKRGRFFHYRRRIPKGIQDLISGKVIQIPLETDSEKIARQRANSLNAIIEDFWQSLNANTHEPESRFKTAIAKAQRWGLNYIPKDELVENSSLGEFVNRIKLAHSTPNQESKEVILGGIERPKITISKAVEDYFKYEKGNLNGKSENQLRKWKNPRVKAIKNFVKVVGDKHIEEINRQDALSFRKWWVDRIEKDGLTANSANKEFGFIKRVISLTVDNYGLETPVDSIFKKLALKEVEKVKRYPFSSEFIKDVLLNPSIINLNDEAHLLIYAMCDTGARISELTGLDESKDIFLNSEIPFIRIQPNTIRNLKTPQSERDIPLVGASLYAFNTLGGGFKKYLGKSDLVSNTINKYFRNHNLLPSKNHSLYSLRHSFEDRLTSVEPPDKLQAALMGHKYNRPRYGLGPSLEQKKSWLDKIATEV